MSKKRSKKRKQSSGYEQPTLFSASGEEGRYNTYRDGHERRYRKIRAQIVAEKVKQEREKTAKFRAELRDAQQRADAEHVAEGIRAAEQAEKKRQSDEVVAFLVGGDLERALTGRYLAEGLH